MARLKLTGRRFGKLVVVRFIRVEGLTPCQRTVWLCRCDCGNTKEITGSKLTASRNRVGTRSCGCLKSEVTVARNYRHGMSKTTIYNRWNAMLTRCNNPKNSHYKDYGGRGIKVCKKWKQFVNFLADMGMPQRGMTLERKNNNQGYNKRNCCWATRTAQARNSRKNRMVSAFGITKPFSEMAERFGIGQPALRARLDNLGWNAEDALTRPIQIQRK